MGACPMCDVTCAAKETYAESAFFLFSFVFLFLVGYIVSIDEVINLSFFCFMTFVIRYVFHGFSLFRVVEPKK